MEETFKPGQTQKELKSDAGEETIARLDRLRYSKGDYSAAAIRGKL